MGLMGWDLQRMEERVLWLGIRILMGISVKAMGWFRFRVWSDGRKMLMAQLVGFDEDGFRLGFGVMEL